MANAAVYIIEPEVVDFMVALNKSFVDFSTEVLPNFLGRIYTYHNSTYHRDIGTIESWECANKELPMLEADFARN